MTEEVMTLAISTAALPEVAVVRDASEAAAAVAAGTGQALESLVGLLEQCLGQLKGQPDDITRVAVCTGPGSFTGLRIGVAFANAFAQARGLPVIGVSSYDVAEFGVAAFPRIAVIKGKVNHYYMRVRLDAAAAAQYTQGDGAQVQALIESVTGSSPRRPVVVGSGFGEPAAGEGARRVALLSMAVVAEGQEHRLRWTGAVIDYGQCPNAVANFEKRDAADQEGRPFQRREPEADEGSAPLA
ncbi:MAG: tRNA (adenosine(37)-N6)-threonylcarbamoyltransferase complex dimerization subunit type 1 TsaB [Candidatus Eremiobacter antarcticus]|nr:MAG: tRNA (adenosine(37)-N6)-threonylcarbamoyltransferase complex dimerization subunit type 1 TsaB [Candidatus Eremiobacter sp. RRmetagenome_bin22]